MPQQEIVISKLRTALPYLHDPEVKEKFESTLDSLEQDILDSGLETSTNTDDCIGELDVAINAFDENAAQKGAELREAARAAREAKAEAGEDEPVTE